MGEMDDRILWLDCEMTGFHPKENTIVEIALILTDAQLNIIDDLPNITIHYEKNKILANMNKYCEGKYAKNGLIDAIEASDVGMEDAENQVFAFLEKHELGGLPVAGRCMHNDRLFLREHMPRVYDYLHHINIDVDTIRALAGRWYNKTTVSKPVQNMQRLQRAYSDIEDSILELKYYKSTIFGDTELNDDQEELDRFKAEKKDKDLEKEDKIVWMRCNMAEIEPDVKTLVEIAAVVTDRKLIEVPEELNIFIKQDDEKLLNMSTARKAELEENGLIDEIRAKGVTKDKAQKEVLSFLRRHVYNGAFLAGNDIFNERLSIKDNMPIVYKRLNHRLIHVNTINELTRRWEPVAFASIPAKSTTNRALDDIRDSIAELRYYRDNVFQK